MHRFLRAWPALVLALAVLTRPAPAQGCSHQGSVPVAATVEPGPVALGCAGAPQWPCWHLLTPAHRAAAPHPGFDPAAAHALPRVLVAWRCTGHLLVPVLPASVATMGYVVDRAETACAATH
jgi:hypothetical protein